MSLNVIKKTIALPDGRQITIETGKLAKQADGSVEVRMGNTVLLATVVSNKDAREGVDFLPMSVDYQEKFAANGKIPGGFLKREARLSDYEVLICRLVDRALRPLFPNNYHSETQVMISLISADQDDMPDALAALAASAALSVSDIPFQGPISEVRVARIDGKYVVNPKRSELENADLNIIVAATEENIMMVEGEFEEVAEADILDALKIAHDNIKLHCQAQKELTIETGNVEKRDYDHEVNDEDLAKTIAKDLYDKVYAVYNSQIAKKAERSEQLKAIRNEYIDALPEDSEVNIDLLKKYYHDVEKDAARNVVLNENVRMDGRAMDEIRPIWSEVDYLPMPHGSAVFTRGETQSLSTVTLGSKLDEQMIDSALGKGFNKFMLHYNFPAFSTGEARPNRGTSRREVGHGNLAYRAIKPMLPSTEDFPYTIRIVSDILESNGSSSMATVCAGTLALMDAGVQIKAPVSGIAMGMISDPETGKYAILSDILGDEDHLGDMDFKVTGTEKGITACQMDIKVDGLSYDVLAEALAQAKKGRLHILGKMKETLSAPNPGLKSNAPQNYVINIPRDLIGAVIGPGGKIVQEIQKESGATVIIEEVENGGRVTVFSPNQDSMDMAVDKIKAIVAMPEEGEEYDGVVKSVVPFGAFIEFMPGKEGLLHISEIKWERIDKMDGVLAVGEEIRIKLIGVDPKSGKFRLSRKVLLPKPAKE
ncbi:MAG: polyribonucleotide nucleotidyltransferase [Cyclobacteriaceae bacterium]|nr:polyribonucleotide nucleotidyltransferase [Cyclobacteriaceae bacterium]